MTCKLAKGEKVTINLPKREGLKLTQGLSHTNDKQKLLQSLLRLVFDFKINFISLLDSMISIGSSPLESKSSCDVMALSVLGPVEAPGAPAPGVS